MSDEALKEAVPTAPEGVEPHKNTEYEVSPELSQELLNRFSYHPPIHDQQRRYIALRSHARAMAVMICTHVPQGRELSLALTKLEEAIFWANAGIARGER